MTHLTQLVLGSTRLDNAGVARLAGLTRLEDLSLAGSGLTDAGLARLAADHPALRSLRLSHHLHQADDFDRREPSQVTDVGLAHLARLKALDSLHVDCRTVTDAGLDALAGLPLRQLALSGVEASGPALGRLLAGRSYDILGLRGSGVTDATLPLLAGQGKLTHLMLGGSPITDAGLARLPRLASLMNLHLSETAITDAGLIRLVPQPALRFLDVRGTAVTPAGVAAFQRAHPTVAVTSGPMVAPIPSPRLR